MATLMLNNNIKKLLVRSISLVLLGAGSSAMAHTTIQNQVTGASTAYNNIVIGHGCKQSNGKYIPVTAQSVVFPTVNPELYEGSTPSNLTLDKIITSLTGLAGIPQLIQNHDVFQSQSEKTDANGNVIGFNAYRGKLDTNLHGLVPFRTGAINFISSTSPKKDAAGNVLSTTDSCVTKLVVKVAVADICKTPFPSGGPKEGMANLWMPNTTTKFANILDGTSATARAGSPATLTFNRDTTANPLDGSCGGTGKTVTVWPSDEDIDANLPIKFVWGR